MIKQIFLGFESNKPKVEEFLPHQGDSKKLFLAYKKEVKKYPIRDWSKSKYNSETKEIYGMNHIEQAVYNFVLKDSGLRVALNEDNKFGDISNLSKGKYYVEFNSLCVSPEKPSYERNNELWEKAMELGEEKFGSIQVPFRINGFYYLPDKTEKGYGVKIIPAPNFEIVQDERLKLRDGLSRFDLTRKLDLVSHYCVLAGSAGVGRVVFVKLQSDASQKK